MINNARKVFCIGANKTGTTSLKKFIEKYTNLKMAHQGHQERYFHKNNFENLKDLKAIKNYIDRFEAFQDIPFSIGHFWQILTLLYPKSQFILSIRSGEEWYNSLINWIYKCCNKSEEDVLNKNLTIDDLKKINWLRIGYSYEVSRKDYISRLNVNTYQLAEDISNLHDKDYMINLYETRNEYIIRYFKYISPNSLYIHDLNNIQPLKLLDWLNIEIDLDQDISFPKENSSEYIFKEN